MRLKSCLVVWVYGCVFWVFVLFVVVGLSVGFGLRRNLFILLVLVGVLVCYWFDFVFLFRLMYFVLMITCFAVVKFLLGLFAWISFPFGLAICVGLLLVCLDFRCFVLFVVYLTLWYCIYLRFVLVFKLLRCGLFSYSGYVCLVLVLMFILVCILGGWSFVALFCLLCCWVYLAFVIWFSVPLIVLFCYCGRLKRCGYLFCIWFHACCLLCFNGVPILLGCLGVA